MLAHEVDTAVPVSLWPPVRRTHDVARLFGITPQALRKASDQGDIVPSIRTADGECLYDSAAVLEYAAYRELREAAATIPRRPKQRRLFELGRSA
jgi:glutathione S-transferase